MERKNVFCLLFVAFLSLNGTYAAYYTGTCGQNLTWHLDSDEGLLVVSGEGEMIGSNYCLPPINQYVKQVQLPEGLTALGNGALGNLQNLESVAIPEGVTSIGERAFFFCQKLESIPLPAGLTYIGKGAFQDCTHLKSITIPSATTTIEQGAFYGCSRMASVSLPENMEIIYANTFQDCKALTQIDLPASLTTIGEQAFAGDIALATITCHALTPPAIAENTFADVPDETLLVVPDESYYLYKNDTYWGRFRMKEAPYEEVPTKVTVDPGETTAMFAWPADTQASSYQIDIYKDGAVFCRLTLGPKGQLLGIAFSLPQRKNAQINEQMVNEQMVNDQDGSLTTLSFMVTGLDEASRYNYVLSVLDAEGAPIHVYIGDFATLGYEGELKGGGNEVIPTPPIIPGNPESPATDVPSLIQPARKSVKLFRDGRLVLILDNQAYDITGKRLE